MERELNQRHAVCQGLPFLVLGVVLAGCYGGVLSAVLRLVDLKALFRYAGLGMGAASQLEEAFCPTEMGKGESWHAPGNAPFLDLTGFALVPCW